MSVLRQVVNITCPNTSPAVNVWHLRTATDAGATAGHADAQAASDALHAFYVSASAYYPTGTVISCDGASDVESDEGVTLTFANVSGGATGTNSAPVLAICIGWKTSSRSRRGMGRTFIGPLNGTATESDGTIATGIIGPLRGYVTTLLNASLVDNGWAYGVWGQVNAAPGVSPETRRTLPHELRDFTSYAIKDKFAVMRSRRP